MKTPTKIMFLGDTHGDSRDIVDMVQAAKRNGVSHIIQLGDTGYRFTSNFLHAVRHACGENDVDFIFVDGNHDEHDTIWRWPFDKDGFQIPPVGTYRERVRYAPRGHRFEFWGVKFLALGGAVSVDKFHRTEGISWWATESIRVRDINKAVDGGDVDVIVAHDHPVNVPIPAGSHRHETTGFAWPEEALFASRENRKMIQFVVDETHPKLFFHGHYHEFRDEVHDGLRVIGLDMNGSPFKLHAMILTEDELKEMLNVQAEEADAGEA